MQFYIKKCVNCKTPMSVPTKIYAKIKFCPNCRVLRRRESKRTHEERHKGYHSDYYRANKDKWETYKQRKRLKNAT